VNALALFAFLQGCLYLLLLGSSIQVERDIGTLPQFLGIWALIFGLYFVSLYLVKKRGSDLPVVSERRWWLFLLASGMAFRITALFMPVVLSHDLYGYMWQGLVQTHGFNPYLYPGNAAALDPLRDAAIWPNVSFKDIVAVYPAFIMHVFRLSSHLAGNSVLGFKALQLLPEAITLLAGSAMLKAYGKNPLWIAVYAWCPLPIVEYLGMGHCDAWGVAGVTLFLWLFRTRRWAVSAAALACGVLVKWLPILFVPWVLKNLPAKSRRNWLLVFVCSGVALYLPFASAGEQILGFLPTFMQSYAFNGSVYKILHALVSRGDWAHQLANLLIGCSALCIAWREKDLGRALLGILLGFFIFSYQVFPWYLGYLLPLLMLRSVWAAWSWLLTVIFSYQVLMPYLWTGTWAESPYILILQYLPFYALLGWQWRRVRGSRFKLQKFEVEARLDPAASES